MSFRIKYSHVSLPSRGDNRYVHVSYTKRTPWETDDLILVLLEIRKYQRQFRNHTFSIEEVKPETLPRHLPYYFT